MYDTIHLFYCTELKAIGGFEKSCMLQAAPCEPTFIQQEDYSKAEAVSNLA